MPRKNWMVLVLILLAAPAWADESSLRFLRWKPGTTAAIGQAQTAKAVYKRKGSEVRVVLYGVLHMAEAAYYKAVQKDLDACDVVLYEGFELAIERKLPPTVKALTDQKRRYVKLLGLQLQADGLNYNAKNLVHADLKYAEQIKTMYADAQGGIDAHMRATRKATDNLEQLIRDDPSLRDRMKLEIARGMGKADVDTMDAKKAETLIIRRNKIAMKVLAAELAKRTKGRIAILYGAGHHKDFHRRLAKLGFTQVKKTWMTAWKLGKR